MSACALVICKKTFMTPIQPLLSLGYYSHNNPNLTINFDFSPLAKEKFGIHIFCIFGIHRTHPITHTDIERERETETERDRERDFLSRVGLKAKKYKQYSLVYFISCILI
jgi:hypothetical protein